MLDQFVKLINTLGFPIAVSLYLLFKVNVQIGALTQSIQDLRKDIAVVIKNRKEE
ncbi:YvrJ family protein [Clostridium arbusti]|uniref:YvrJ family protein n=1 Tax=Clostridium arbusti TaxID=1137848 RepID=UPI0002888BB7|nr:YvrJ family protein [Clostridium arbusti]